MLEQKNSFENNVLTSKRKPNLIETDREKEFYDNFFQNFSNTNNIKHYSRKSLLGAVSAESFNRTISDFLERPVFEKTESNWIDVLSVITKQYKNRVHFSFNVTPLPASLKMNEGYVYHNLLDKTKKMKP